MRCRLSGLIAAAFTPLDQHGDLRLERVPAMVDRLIEDGVSGLYVCGSTGEGVLLTSDERRRVAEAFVEAAAGRIPVVVQVGHNSIGEAAALAGHAQQIGADVVSAAAPSYFKVTSLDALIGCMERIAAAAPRLPFYYYHIPALTGAALDMVAFLEQAADRIPTLAGLKYTQPTVHEYQACRELQDERFDVLWGCDEMLLAALAAGAEGAVGSTYNFAAPLYRRIIEAFRAGRLGEARRLQGLSVLLVRTLYEYPFHAAAKRIMKALGDDCGGCRPPLGRLSGDQEQTLLERLEAIGFFRWGRTGPADDSGTC